MHPLTARHDVIVVGGGQAGLALGYFLAHQGREFRILEAADEPAAAWRQRWDSLKLFAPVRYTSLPGLAFPGDPDGYPSRDDARSHRGRPSTSCSPSRTSAVGWPTATSQSTMKAE